MTCIHRWVIEEADGPSSPGECQNCGEKKFFLNYIEWNYNSQPSMGRHAELDEIPTGVRNRSER